MATRIPINKEAGRGLGLEDRQKRIWEDMETDMERRRREWEQEIDKMRKEFFMLRPEGGDSRGGGASQAYLPPGALVEGLAPRSRLLESNMADDSRGMVVKDEKGNPVFKVLFDVHDYRPEEVSVKMDANKIMVSARHEAKDGGSSVSREYNREVKIPNQLDPLTLQCSMGPDGILAVEAPIPAPSYSALQDSAPLPVRTASPSSAPLQHSSSSSSSYHTTSYPPPSQPPQASFPAGFKPVATPFLNSAPPAPASVPSPPSQPLSNVSSSSSSHTSYRDVRDTSSPAHKAAPPYPGVSSGAYTPPLKANPPFQGMSTQQSSTAFSPPLKGGGGRMGSPVVSTEGGKYKLEMDIDDFKPEELTVKTQDGRVVVCGRRQEQTGPRSSSRELSREYTIPDSVDPLTIKAFFTDAGKLIVEAPYRQAAAASHPTAR